MTLPDRQGFGRSRPGLTFLLLATMGVVPAATALEIIPSVTVGAVYTDNLFLTPDNETSDLVGRIDPSINITHQSQRINLRADYTYSYLGYAETDDVNGSFNEASGALDLVLIPNLLTLETVGELSQQLIDPENGVFYTNVSIVDNRTDEARLETSPHLQTEIGGIGIDSRYVVGLVNYDAPDIQDVDYQEWHTAITGEERNKGLSWGLYHDWELYEYETPPDNTAQLAYLTLTYGLRQTGDFFVFGSIGMESDYQDFTDASLVDTYWAVGFRRQTSRTLVEASFGERSFGSTWGARIRREINEGSIELSYREDPSVDEQIFEQRPAVDDTPQPPETPGNIDRRGVGDRFIYKLLSASLVRALGRNEVSLLLFNEVRDEFLDRTDTNQDPVKNSETETGIVLGLSRQIGRRTTVGASGQYSQREFRDGNDDEVSELRGFVIYDLGRKLSLEGWLARYEQQGSDNPNDNYQEFQTGLSANYSFR
ncbi:MAG: TIGR03016 family PEP-CTERM system-associated outer membrane protein [Chromatiales bacterium]|nr:TIGR03016 family PEP-CTERM system-associated outer membrane protein [Chromatiales bacterium]